MITGEELSNLLCIPAPDEQTLKKLEFYRDAAIAQIENRTERKFAPEGAEPTEDELPRSPDLIEAISVLVRARYDHADDMLEGKLPNGPWQGINVLIDPYKKF